MGLLATPINNLADGFNNFIDGIGEFFSDLIDSLGNWFTDVWNSLVELNNDIGNWFEELGNNIGGFITDINNSVSNWFSDVWNSLVELNNDIGNWFEELGNNISGFFSELSIKINTILSYLDPFSENFFLKLAFIPSDGFITAKFNEVKVVFEERLPIIGTLTEIFNLITDAQSNESTKPKFEIELPSKWGGQTVEVINFDIIDPYIPYVKTFIRILLWIPFIIKIYRRLPQIIY